MEITKTNGAAEQQPLSTIDRWAGALSSPIEGRIVLGPNWFASVMGTGIIAIAGAILPVKFSGLFAIASAAWMLAAVLLVAMLVVIPGHWIRRRGTFTALTEDPISIPFFEAPPMALMTVGTATLLVGAHYVGQQAAVVIDSILWVAGTMSLVASLIITSLIWSRLAHCDVCWLAGRMAVVAGSHSQGVDPRRAADATAGRSGSRGIQGRISRTGVIDRVRQTGCQSAVDNEAKAIRLLKKLVVR